MSAPPQANTRSSHSKNKMDSLSRNAPTIETLTERRSRWSALLRQGHFQAIIEEVLEQEKPKYPNSKVIDFGDKVSLLKECALILASATSVFTAAVDGDLVSRIRKDTDLQRDYDMIQERAHHQPSIYIHLLADENGAAPTPNQYLQIRYMILGYISGDQVSEHAYAIDSTSAPHVTKKMSNSGQRKYVHTDRRSVIRIGKMKNFCDGIEQRWRETSLSERDIALRFPPGECGYSENSHIRLAEHRKHRSSNYIMNVVEDICTYLHTTGVFTQHFGMHQFIIYLIFRPSQASIAEIFCSGLLEVWIDNGGGFNGHPAGLSVTSKNKVSHEKWEEHERWVRETSLLDKRFEIQKERAESWGKALEWQATDTDEEMLDVDE